MTLQLPTGRLKMRLLSAPDVIAHWRLEGTGGTNVADAAGLSALTSTATIVDGPHTGESANKGRRFSGANSASGTPTLGQRAALLGNVTVEARFNKDELTTAGALICCGTSNTDATEANNTLIQLHVRAGGGVSCAWESTAGGDVVCDFTSAIPATTDVSVAVRRRLVVSTCTVDLFINGRLVETQVGKAPPVGGGSAVWRMANGLDPSLGAGFFAGAIYEVRIAGVALSDEAIRDSHARAVRDWDLARVIASGIHKVETRALLRNVDGVWFDLADLYDVNFVKGFEDSDDVDADGATGRLTLRRRHAHLSLAPFVGTSRPNAADPDGQLLDLGRRIKLEEAYLPHGASRAAIADVHWQLVFDGYARVISDDGETLTLTLSGRERALQVAWCQPNRAPNPDEDFRYASSATPIETVLTQILTDHAPTSIGGTVEGYAGGDDFTLWVPTSPSFVVDNSETTSGGSAGFTIPSSKPVFQACTDLVDATIAWFFRFAFDETRQEFRLALLDPGRAKVWTATDRTLTASTIKRWRKLEVNDDAIRNDVELEYGDSTVAKDNVGVNKRLMVRVEDAASVGRWWRRYCRVGLSSTGQLNTSAQATDLANRMLSDLASPVAEAEIDVPPRRDIGVGDMIRVVGEGRRHSVGANIDFAVVGVRNTRRRSERVTVLTVRRAKPAGRVRRWLEMVQQRGINRARGLTPPPTPPAPTLTAIAGGIWVEWPFPVNFGGRRYRETEIHVGASSGFTPSSLTLKAIVRGKNAAALEVDPTVVAHVKLVHRDDMHNASAAGAAASSTPRFLPRAPSAHATRSGNQTLTAAIGVVDVIWNAETAGSDPFGSYNPATGVWTQLKAGFLSVEGSILFDSNGKAGGTARLQLLVDGATVKENRDAAGAIVNSVTSGSPSRCICPMSPTRRWVGAGSTVKVQVVYDGFANSLVVADANFTWIAFESGLHT